MTSLRTSSRTISPEVRCLNKAQIMGILPHRGRMLLLDSVSVQPDFARSRFIVTLEVCKGHEVAGGRPLFRGVDMIEMAAQTLGVYWAVKRPELKGRTVLFRSVGKVKFRGWVSLGQEVQVSIPLREVAERFAPKGAAELIGKNIIVGSSGAKKAQIASLTLVLLSNKS